MPPPVQLSAVDKVRPRSRSKCPNSSSIFMAIYIIRSTMQSYYNYARHTRPGMATKPERMPYLPNHVRRPMSGMVFIGWKDGLYPMERWPLSHGKTAFIQQKDVSLPSKRCTSFARKMYIFPQKDVHLLSDRLALSCPWTFIVENMDEHGLMQSVRWCSCDAPPYPMLTRE